MPKKASPDEIQYHIGLSKNMIEHAEYVVLPGDPHRCQLIANAFDKKAKFLADSREHVSYLANFHNQKVLICSTGLGAPNVGITMEELAVIGLKYYLRTGTCGAIQPHINLGDIIISNAAVRFDGASKDYAPVEYPAVSSFEFTSDIMTGAKDSNIPHHLGITASTDTFWQAQERYDSYTGHVLRNKRGIIEELAAINVLNFEMEASALFVMASAMKLHAACICGVVAVRYESEKVSLEAKKGSVETNLENMAIAGIYQSMKRRKMI